MEKRYTRQYLLPEWDETKQQRLKESRVLVAGSGGLGSPLLQYITAAGIGEITIIDCDTVEISNLNRQILFNVTDIDKPKSETAVEKLSKLNNEIIINAINTKIEDISAAEFQNYDLFIDCLDSFRSRLYLNRKSIETSTPLLHAGVTGYSGQVSLFAPGMTPCLNCIIGGETSELEDKSIMGASAGVIGSIQASEAIKFLAFKKNFLENKILFVDLMSLRFRIMEVSRNPTCAACSQN